MSAAAVLQAAALAQLSRRMRVFTAPPLRASLPRVVLDDAVLAAADAVGVSGRVGTIGVTCTDSGEQPDRLRMLVEQVETAMAAIPPDLGAGWRLAALTLTRSRIVHGKEVRGDARSERGEQWTATCLFAVRMFRIN